MKALIQQTTAGLAEEAASQARKAAAIELAQRQMWHLCGIMGGHNFEVREIDSILLGDHCIHCGIPKATFNAEVRP